MDKEVTETESNSKLIHYLCYDVNPRQHEVRVYMNTCDICVQELLMAKLLLWEALGHV